MSVTLDGSLIDGLVFIAIFNFRVTNITTFRTIDSHILEFSSDTGSWYYKTNTKGSEMTVTSKYNQQTKEWNSKVVKVKKQYGYIPVLNAKILHIHKEDVDLVTRNVSLNESNPALLAATIADKPATP